MRREPVCNVDATARFHRDADRRVKLPFARAKRAPSVNEHRNRFNPGNLTGYTATATDYRCQNRQDDEKSDLGLNKGDRWERLSQTNLNKLFNFV